MRWRAGAVSTDDAVACVRSGMHVFVHGAAATPTPLLEALVRRPDLSGVTLYHLHTSGAAPFAAPGQQGRFRSVSFFAGATRNLLSAESRSGITHHIALTIVGADAAPDGYYAGKLSQERLIEAGDVPWTILRATQFHEYAALMFATVRAGPLHAAPRARVQPIAVREVAEHLVGLAEAGPGGRVTELAGPREESLSRMVLAYARAIGHRGPLPEISLPGAFGRAQRNGSLLPKPGATLGVQTFDEWLEALPDR